VKGYSYQYGRVATVWKRLRFVRRGPRLRPRRIIIHARQPSGITSRIEASAIKGRTALIKSQQTFIIARNRPQAVFDAGVNPELFLQLSCDGRNVVVTVAESKYLVMGTRPLPLHVETGDNSEDPG